MSATEIRQRYQVDTVSTGSPATNPPAAGFPPQSLPENSGVAAMGDQLGHLVAQYGRSGKDLASDERLCEAVLLDHFPSAPAEVRALVEAIPSGSVQALRDWALSGPELAIGSSAAQLAGNGGLRDDLAQWAMTTWWNALSLGRQSYTPTVDQQRPIGGRSSRDEEIATSDRQWPVDDRSSRDQALSLASARVRRGPSRAVRLAIAVVVGAYVLIASTAHVFPFASSLRGPTPHEALLAAIPNSSTAGCIAWTASYLAKEVPTAEAEETCQPIPGGPKVNYFIFSTQTAAANNFASNVASGTPSGNCSMENSVQGYYTVGSKANAGKLACFEHSGHEELLWWHFSDNIVAANQGSSLGWSTLIGDWKSGLGPT